jgi:hypothetical protein
LYRSPVFIAQHTSRYNFALTLQSEDDEHQAIIIAIKVPVYYLLNFALQTFPERSAVIIDTLTLLCLLINIIFGTDQSRHFLRFQNIISQVNSNQSNHKNKHYEQASINKNI